MISTRARTSEDSLRRGRKLITQSVSAGGPNLVKAGAAGAAKIKTPADLKKVGTAGSNAWWKDAMALIPEYAEQVAILRKSANMSAEQKKLFLVSDEYRSASGKVFAASRAAKVKHTADVAKHQGDAKKVQCMQKAAVAQDK